MAMPTEDVTDEVVKKFAPKVTVTRNPAKQEDPPRPTADVEPIDPLGSIEGFWQQSLGNLLPLFHQDPFCLNDTVSINDAFTSLWHKCLGCCPVLGPSKGIRGFVSERDLVALLGNMLQQCTDNSEKITDAVSASLRRPLHYLLTGRIGHGIITSEEQWPPSTKLNDFVTNTFGSVKGSDIAECVTFCRQMPAPHYRTSFCPYATVKPLDLLCLSQLHLSSSLAQRHVKDFSVGRRTKVTLPVGTPLHIGVTMLYSEGVNAIPVTDDSGHCCGLLTLGHCLAVAADPTILTKPLEPCTLTANDLIASHPGGRWVTMQMPSATLASAVNSACEHMADWVLLEDPDNELRIVTSLDLLMYLVNSEGSST